MKIRLSKLLSEKKICSRREAEDLISKGLVKVGNEIICEQGYKVDRDAVISLLPGAKKHKVTILLNKPVGYVSCMPEKNYRPAISLLTKERKIGGGPPFGYFQKLAVAGRLDIDSKGLLIFTQDGVIARTLIGSDSTIEKEYRVFVGGSITSQKIQDLSFGLSLDGKLLKKARIELIEEQTLRFILQEGKKRQIRRMCEQVGLTVRSLQRVRVGNVLLGNLLEGHWRYLRSDESF